jgi:hypothetical protein
VICVFLHASRATKLLPIFSGKVKGWLLRNYRSQNYTRPCAHLPVFLAHPSLHKKVFTPIKQAGAVYINTVLMDKIWIIPNSFLTFEAASLLHNNIQYGHFDSKSFTRVCQSVSENQSKDGMCMRNFMRRSTSI